MRKFASFFVILLLIAAVSAVSAQEKEIVKVKKCQGEPLEREVKIKLEKLKLQHELSLVDLKAAKEKIHGEIMDELLKEEPSVKTLEKLGQSMNDVHYKMHKAKIDYLLEVKKVLPADHWEPFLHNHFAAMGAGCPGKGCCEHGKECKSDKGCCMHESKATGCPMAGVKGHVCSDACLHSEGKAGCEMKCIKVKK